MSRRSRTTTSGGWRCATTATRRARTRPCRRRSRNSTASRTGCRSDACTRPGCKTKDPVFRPGLSQFALGAPLGVPATRCRRPHLLEAGAAVHRLVATRLERNACLTAAVAAGRGEELTRATHAPAAAGVRTAAHAAGGATRRTAARATTRLVHETARGIELLLSRSPHEFLTAVLAGQSLVREAHFEASSL